MLEDLIVSSKAVGAISTITLAGQNLNASGGSFPIQMLKPAAQLEGFRSLSIPINTSQKFEISGKMTVAQNIGMAVSTSPIAPSQFVPTSQLGGALNYIFGVSGASDLPAAASTTLSATCLRDCVLGRIVIVNQDGVAVPNEDLNVTSILVEGIELLSGEQGVDVVNIDVMGAECTDLNGLQLNYPITSNGQFRITIKNNNAGIGKIGIGIFCLPA